MSETYLVKPNCGTHIVYDQGELERHLGMGWQVRPDNWMEREMEARRKKRLAALKVEQERLEAEVAAEEEPKRGPGRPKKVAAE